MRSDRVARIAALCLAALVAMVAVELLLIGLELPSPVSAADLRIGGDWIGDRRREGVLMLVGVGFVVVGLVLAWSFLSGLRPRRDAVVTRRRGGWTKVDCVTLGHAIERELDALDGQTRVDVRVRPSGKVNVVVATPDPTVVGPVADVREELVDLVEQRNLPCEIGRVEVTDSHRRTARVR